MKKLNNILLFFFALAVALAGCKDEELNHTNVTPVTSLYAPDDNAFMNLGAQSSASFEWQAAKAEDNGVVLYEVAFTTETGDFSDPLYTVPSNGNGLQRTLTLPFATLNEIARRAGIEPEQTGKLKWTVLSSKGINVQESVTSRIIEVERPAGFPAPDELYITGSATEGGDALENGLLMKKTGPSTFEVYTKLVPGDYAFATRNAGTPDMFFIENGKLRQDGVTTVAQEGVYRIRLDFTTATTEIAEITLVSLWFAPNDVFMFDLPYAGNGTWKAEDQSIVFRQEDWGRDERYKFRFKVNTGGNEVDEWYGSVNADNSRPTESTQAAYWFMVPVTNDRWNNSFKFATEVDNSQSDVSVIFNAEVPAYTHVVTPN